MIVLNAETLGYSDKAILNWQEKGFSYQPSSWDEIESKERFDDVAILIVRLQKKIDEKILSKFPGLKIIVSATTGHDHLDLKALEKRGIKLVSLRGQDEFLKTIPSTAEHCFGLLLSLIRNIPAANESVKLGSWNRDHFRGFQLKNKTLGIIGLGRTGSMMAVYASCFGMKPVYFDPLVSNEKYNRIDDLSSLLKVADVISIHVHLTDQTRHLLNKENLSFIKAGSFVLNTSRGDVWDEDAVVELLTSNQIKGVATDVLSGELTDIKSSSLWKAQQMGYNVIITPHIGGATFDAMWACEEFITSLVERLNN